MGASSWNGFVARKCAGGGIVTVEMVHEQVIWVFCGLENQGADVLGYPND